MGALQAALQGTPPTGIGIDGQQGGSGYFPTATQVLFTRGQLLVVKGSPTGFKYLFTSFDLVVGLVVYVEFAFFVGAVGVCS